jgi:hypothetical protein
MIPRRVLVVKLSPVTAITWPSSSPLEGSAVTVGLPLGLLLRVALELTGWPAAALAQARRRSDRPASDWLDVARPARAPPDRAELALAGTMTEHRHTTMPIMNSLRMTSPQVPQKFYFT